MSTTMKSPDRVKQKTDQRFRLGMRSLVGSGALAVVSMGGWAVYALLLNRPPEAVIVKVLQVERGTVETVVNESGTVELGGQQTLVSPAEGAVEQVLVQPGDRVTAGEILITLRNPDRQTALQDQQIKITQQEVTLVRSRQQITEAQEKFTLEQRRLENLRAIADEGALPQNQVLDQENVVRELQSTLRQAQTTAETAALELRSLRLQLQRTQQQLEDTVITAPIDGIVLDVQVKDGDGVELRTELLTLGDPTEELVKLQLSTLNAAQIRLNQLARVSVIGPDPDIFTGRVLSIYPQALRSSADQSSTQQDGQAIVPTTVLLDRPTRTLIPGSQVNVEIVLKQRPNVVTLGAEAVQRNDARPFVWQMDEAGQAEKQFITLGLEGLTTVEVTSGLKAGDEIILPPPDVLLESGMPVTPEP